MPSCYSTGVSCLQICNPPAMHGLASQSNEMGGDRDADGCGRAVISSCQYTILCRGGGAHGCRRAYNSSLAGYASAPTPWRSRRWPVRRTTEHARGHPTKLLNWLQLMFGACFLRAPRAHIVQSALSSHASSSSLPTIRYPQITHKSIHVAARRACAYLGNAVSFERPQSSGLPPLFSE